MAYAKKILILNQVNEGFAVAGEKVRGLVSLEDCGDGEVQVRVDIFNISQVRRGFLGIVLKCDGFPPHAHRVSGKGSVMRYECTLKSDSFELSGRLFCVVGFVSDDKVVPILWGANNALMLKDTRIMDGFAQLVNPEVFVGKVESVKKLDKSHSAVLLSQPDVETTASESHAIDMPATSEHKTEEELSNKVMPNKDNIAEPNNKSKSQASPQNSSPKSNTNTSYQAPSFKSQPRMVGNNYDPRGIIIKHGFDRESEPIEQPSQSIDKDNSCKREEDSSPKAKSEAGEVEKFSRDKPPPIIKREQQSAGLKQESTSNREGTLNRRLTDFGRSTTKETEPKPSMPINTERAKPERKSVVLPPRVRVGGVVTPPARQEARVSSIYNRSVGVTTPPAKSQPVITDKQPTNQYNDTAVLGYNPYPADIDSRVTARVTELGAKWSGGGYLDELRRRQNQSSDAQTVSSKPITKAHTDTVKTVKSNNNNTIATEKEVKNAVVNNDTVEHATADVDITANHEVVDTMEAERAEEVVTKKPKADIREQIKQQTPTVKAPAEEQSSQETLKEFEGVERFVKSWSGRKSNAQEAPHNKPQQESKATANKDKAEEIKTDKRRYDNYYLNIKSELDELFGRCEPLAVLNRNLPDSRWVKVVADEGGGQFYAVGLIGDNPDYIGYGVPGKFSVNPPKELEEYCQWLPLDSTNPKGEGYWMMYQDAETGATVRLDIID